MIKYIYIYFKIFSNIILCIIYISNMTNNIESKPKYVPYKEFVKKRALDYYYYANKEIINKKNKNKYKSLSPEQKKKRRENSKQWFNKQSPEKQAELRQKAREYHKDRCHNLMVAVK